MLPYETCDLHSHVKNLGNQGVSYSVYYFFRSHGQAGKVLYVCSKNICSKFDNMTIETLYKNVAKFSSMTPAPPRFG